MATWIITEAGCTRSEDSAASLRTKLASCAWIIDETVDPPQVLGRRSGRKAKVTRLTRPEVTALVALIERAVVRGDQTAHSPRDLFPGAASFTAASRAFERARSKVEPALSRAERKTAAFRTTGVGGYKGYHFAIPPAGTFAVLRPVRDDTVPSTLAGLRALAQELADRAPAAAVRSVSTVIVRGVDSATVTVDVRRARRVGAYVYVRCAITNQTAVPIVLDRVVLTNGATVHTAARPRRLPRGVSRPLDTWMMPLAPGVPAHGWLSFRVATLGDDMRLVANVKTPQSPSI